MLIGKRHSPDFLAGRGLSEFGDRAPRRKKRPPFLAPVFARLNCSRSYGAALAMDVSYSWQIRIVAIAFKEEAMNKDQFEGRVEQAEGQVKEPTGEVADNRGFEEHGKLHKTVGKVRSSCDDLKENLKDNRSYYHYNF